MVLVRHTSGAAKSVRRSKIRYGDAISQYGHLYLADAASECMTTPLVVLVHGGYWTTEFGVTVETAIARDLATRGAVVWNVEYRRVGEPGGGWPNTGRDVVAALRALDGVVPEEMGADLAGQVDWNSIAVVGHSAGGQLAVWATAQLAGRTRRTQIRTVIAQSAALDMVGAGAVGRQSVIDLIGRPYVAAPHLYRDASPTQQPPFDAHVVAIHTADDTSIPVRVSRDYVAAATARGQSAELVVVPDGGHNAFVDPRSAAHRQTVRVLGL